MDITITDTITGATFSTVKHGGGRTIMRKRFSLIFFAVTGKLVDLSEKKWKKICQEVEMETGFELSFTCNRSVACEKYLQILEAEKKRNILSFHVTVS